MARKRGKESSLQGFEAELRAPDKVGQDVRLPSLSQIPARLQGYSFKFTPVLPLLSATGEEVFTSGHFSHLHDLLCRRFGGISAASSASHPPLYGYYQPTKGGALVKDYHTQLVVYSAPVDAANHFFAKLKAILRVAPLQAQDEILIERIDAMLI